MNEAQVKAKALSFIRSATGRRSKPIVASEFTLGTSGVRADLAILAEDFVGIEIKTEKDTLRRLPYQMEAYQDYFQAVILITARCHLDKINPDMLFGASLWTYDMDCSLLQLCHEGQHNSVSSRAIGDLMTQAERKAYQVRGLQNAEQKPIEQLRAVFEKRYATNSKKFWQAVSRRNIRPDDLALLSRFAEDRQKAQLFSAEKESRWSSWLAAQGCLVAA